jgi:hypothetical protein
MNVKVITGYDGPCLYWQMHIDNVTQYCQRHGYRLIARADGWEPSPLHCFWRKVGLVRQELQDCDFVFWLDADTVILNMPTSLEEFVDDEHDLFIAECGIPHLGVPYYCCGVFLLRVCEWSRRFMDDWWGARTQGDNDNTVLMELLRDGRSTDRIRGIQEPRFHGRPEMFGDETFVMHAPGRREYEKRDVLQKFASKAGVL